MKAYTKFINQIFGCVSGLFPDQMRKLDIFAESSERICSGIQEYAVLRNENADLFCSLITQNTELFGMAQHSYQPVHSPLYPSERKISHSCYPKNIKRWMNGVISRKKSCRVEFCVLAWCHIQNWNRLVEKEQEQTFLRIRRELLKICNEFLDTQYEQLSLECLWKASCAAYKMSFSKI